MVNTDGLADFLRARRDLVTPADVGLPDGERRRVEGLRREEVAMLAGISTEYYLRLEQGREHRPSDAVLEGLARALQLSDDATEYMRSLARPTPRRRRRVPLERVDPRIQSLIDSWPLNPTYVQGRRITILAANPMARALTPLFSTGVNLVRAMFLDPEVPSFVRNWDAISAMLVAYLRFLVVEEDVTDPGLQSLIGELSIGSARFRTLWARQDVKQKTTGPIMFDHPHVGQLDLRYRTLIVPEAGQVIVTYQAEPGSPSEERLRMLSSLVTREG